VLGHYARTMAAVARGINEFILGQFSVTDNRMDITIWWKGADAVLSLRLFVNREWF